MVQNLNIAESRVFIFSKLFKRIRQKQSEKNEMSHVIHKDAVDEKEKKEKGSIVIRKRSDQ